MSSQTDNFDIVVIGSCIMDLISYVPRLPTPGETLQAHRFTTGFGGKGANQCVMAAKLGARTAIVAKLGNDTFGKSYLENLKKHNINTDYVTISEEAATGVASITVDDKGQNSITIACGANLDLSEADVMAAEDLICRCRVLICQWEVPISTSLFAMKLAHKHGVKTIFNPAPCEGGLPPEMLSYCDIICPNEVEAFGLTQMAVNTTKGAEEAGKSLQTRGSKSVVITLGDRGAVLCDMDGTTAHISAKPVHVVDTTGAGDAFVGSLAYFMSSCLDLTLKTMIERSCDIASISVTKPGTQVSFPCRTELPQELFSHRT